uniref:F-box and WD repeat domain containing 10 n=1 Tax=Lates calcarifer TaxID=8187 RepID=A0A4W6E0F6_LATCA
AENIKSVKFSRSVSACELNCKTAEGCLNMCGMCPSCIFAPTPSGSTHCLWKVSDEFKRRFVVELLLRCRNVQVLEGIQSVLGATPWTLLTYARSRGPTSPQDYPCRTKDGVMDGKPLGVDVNEIWDWFGNSPDWVKSRYLCRVFTLCDSELLRMVSNLTSVLLVRQKRVSSSHTSTDEDSDDPALMVVPGSSKSVSGVSRYRDFIGCLPVHLSKRILGKSIHTHNTSVLSPEANTVTPVWFVCLDLAEKTLIGWWTTEAAHLWPQLPRTDVLHLFYVASETRVVSVMKGHVGSIRAVLLCEDRNLVITASCDASIRCWNLKTDRCEMVLYGHTGTVNCLDVHADRLVSGAKDCIVKVWNLHTGKQFEDFNFKHPSSIQCVKISATKVYSSCDRGLVKIWDMEKASLLRVIDAHRSSVKCLFFDEWHLLSGDFNGQVMAWSTHCCAKECLMTFSHPREVKSLTLVYLRVVTGCADGKIRIFNFLTGDCLRDITAEAETDVSYSLSLSQFSILVNTTSCVKLYQFAKVFWDYTESAEGGRGDVLAQDGLISEKSAASVRKPPSPSIGADHRVQVALPSDSKKPERAELPYHTRILFTPTKCQTQGKHAHVEKATSERMKKRGLHHPLTRDSILLRVNAIQKAQCMDEVGINMECNARLRDSWGPHTQALETNLQAQVHPLRHTHHRRAKTCVPVLKTAASQHMTNTDVTPAPDAMRRRHHCLFSQKAQPHSADTQTAIKRVGAKEEPRAD